MLAGDSGSQLVGWFFLTDQGDQVDVRDDNRYPNVLEWPSCHCIKDGAEKVHGLHIEYGSCNTIEIRERYSRSPQGGAP